MSECDHLSADAGILQTLLEPHGAP
jgi:hypothetical protein